MNTLALYYRASNGDDNLGESATIQNQRDLLQNYIQNKPEFADWNVLEFQDDGWSGTTFDRPGIQKLLNMAGKEVSCIVVKDFSRLGRNLIEVGNFLDQVFPFLGVRFIAVNENYDSRENLGHTIGLDISLRAMVYEMYSRDLSKKISSVKEGKMRKGQYAGSFSFYGYERTDDTPSGLKVDPESAQIVKRIFSLAASGIKTKDIAVALNKEGILPPLSYRRRKYPSEGYQCPTATVHNVWMQDRVMEILKDERYTGTLISKKYSRPDISSKKFHPVNKEDWIRVDNALEMIVTQEEFEQAQKIFHKCMKRDNASKPIDLFRGLLKCAYCGKALAKVPGKRITFRCETGRFQPSFPCAEVIIKKSDLERVILTSLQYEICPMIHTDTMMNKTETKLNSLIEPLKRLEEDIKKLKTQKLIFFEQYGSGNIDREGFVLKKQEISNQIDALYAKQKAIKIEKQERKEFLGLMNESLGKYAALESLSREMLTGLVKEIRVWQDNSIEIIWNFNDIMAVIVL